LKIFAFSSAIWKRILKGVRSKHFGEGHAGWGPSLQLASPVGAS